MIYSVKASKPGVTLNGWRVKAGSMQGATFQVNQYLSQLGGGFTVSISQLKNQAAALKKWEKDNS